MTTASQSKPTRKLTGRTHVLAVLALCLVGLQSYAGITQEKVDLARINSVLNAVYPLIDQAEAEATPTEKRQFHYDWLRSDVAAMQAGIAEKINSPRITPRIVAPLKTSFVTSGDA